MDHDINTENNSRCKDKMASFAAIAIIVLIIGIVAVCVSIFGGAIMKVFGFEYRSMWSMILFFIISGILSWPAELIAGALLKVLYKEFHRITLKQAKVLYVILDTLVTITGMVIVDYFMDSVSASDLAVFAAALVFALASTSEVEEEH